MTVRVTGHDQVKRIVEVVVESGKFKGCQASYLADRGLIVWKKMPHPFPRNYDPKPIEEEIIKEIRNYLAGLNT